MGEGHSWGLSIRPADPKAISTQTVSLLSIIDVYCKLDCLIADGEQVHVFVVVTMFCVDFHGMRTVSPAQTNNPRQKLDTE